MPFASFLAIAFLKGIGNSYVSGNLFSFFGLISIAQAIMSALAMYGIKKLLKTHVSNYGISMVGAFISTLVQIFLASLFLGAAITALMPIMLLSSLCTSIFIAFISYRIPIPKRIPETSIEECDSNRAHLCIINLIVSGFSIMVIDSIPLALIAFLVALSFQRLTGRRIRIIPYLILATVLVLSSIITPIGKTIIKLGPISITDIALENALKNALVLSSGIALSQGYSQIIEPGKGLLGKTLAYFTALLASFRNIEGKTLMEKAQRVLSINALESTKRDKKKDNNALLCLFSLIFLTLAVLSTISR